MKININFIRYRMPAIIFSFTLIFLGLWMIYGPRNVNLGIFTPKGFNLGVEFKGGLVQQITVYNGISQEELRSLADEAGLGNDVQQIIVPEDKKITRSSTSYIIRTMINDKEQKEIDEKGITAANYFENKNNDFYSLLRDKKGTIYELKGDELKKANETYMNTWIHGEFEDRKTDSLRVLDNVVRDSINVTSSSYAQILQGQALILISIALLIIFVYVFIRFGYKFGIGGIFSTIHDTMVMLGFVAFFQIELDMTVIAALLTLIGYSINDTIVIFDRVRENYTVMKDSPPKMIFNSSINQTLSRTLITSVGALGVVMALYLLGGPKINGFSIVLFVGILFGTYSSIFIAAPVVDFWDTLFSKKEKQRVLKEKKKEEELKLKNENQPDSLIESKDNNASSENVSISSLSKSKLKKLSGKLKK